MATSDGSFDQRLFGDDCGELIHRQGERLDRTPRAFDELVLDLHRLGLLALGDPTEQAGHHPEQHNERQHQRAPEDYRADATRRDGGQPLFDL